MPADPTTDENPTWGTNPDTELVAEQHYLDHARAELTRMREHTLSLEADAGNRISAEDLARMLWLRAASLADDPTGTLFFGRLDTSAESATRADGTTPADGQQVDGAQRYYIGRRHVSDAGGDPVVIDWRAPVSTPFYRASSVEPMGVHRRRRFGVDHGRITAYEDEILDQAITPDSADTAPAAGRSQILAAEIERPRVGPMRDIVATIQPEQDEIVRAELGRTICVQGAPGTGKTAVGLHRIAWLLYSYRDRLARQGVLVIGPNRAFLDHIGAVLPALGEVQVRHTTAADLLGEQTGATIRGTDPTSVALLKGDPRMATVLSRAVWGRVGRATEALVVPRGSRRWRVPAYEVQEILDELRSRGVRYGSARAMLPQRLAHAVLVAMERSGDAPDDRVQDSVARSRPVKDYVASLWPTLDAPQVLFDLLTDPARLAEAAEGTLSTEEQHAVLWPTTPRSKRSAKWSMADAVLLDELGDLIDRAPRLGHVVLDEAQDLSPMHLRAVGRRGETGSLTVLGDIAQGTTPWATSSWEAALDHLGQPGAHLEVLDRGFRVPSSVIDYAARLLPTIAPGLGAPQSVRDNPGLLHVGPPVPSDSVAAATVQAVKDAAVELGSIGVIAPAAQVGAVARALDTAEIGYSRLGVDGEQVPEADHAADALPPQVHLLPAGLAKGLEFDHVVLAEPATIVADEPDHRTGLRRLYVVLTRAVSSLRVVHSAPLPPELEQAAD